MAKKKVTIRLSLIFLMALLITITAVTILGVSDALRRNSINWSIETLSQKISENMISKIQQAGKKADIKATEVIKKEDISPNSRVYYLDDNFRILASAEKENDLLKPDRYAGGKLKIFEVTDPVLKKSYKKYLKNEKKKHRKIARRKFDHFAFWYDWHKHIGMVKSFTVKGGKKRYLAMIFPFRDFFGSITRNNIILYSITAFFIGLAILISMMIARRISTPLSKLAEEAEAIRNFDLESQPQIHSFLLEVENMSTAMENMRSGLKSFKKYVPADLVKELIQMGQEAELGGERKELTMFFSDIAGFTTISEKLPPEELVNFLGEYLGAMTRIIMEHKGTVDKYIGDAIMAFWGAPHELPNHAKLACASALHFQRRLTELGEKWRSEGKPDFHSRVGLNTGEVIVGNMGYEDRMNYTVIGDPVNLASRLEALNKVYGTRIMMGEGTYSIIKDDFDTRFLDIVAVKGKQEGIKVYELLAEKGAASSAEKAFKETYEAALSEYLKRNFEKAKSLFEEARQQRGGDASAEVFIRRCDEFIATPPPENWSGVFVAKTK